MAISNTCTFEIRVAGSGSSDLNAGGFNSQGGSPGTDRSNQDSPHVTIDGATITAVVHTTTTQLNITGYTVTSADNRNLVRVTSGTATAGLYEITAIDAVNNRWTLDRAVGTAAQTVTAGRMGGANATPGLVGGIVHNVGGIVWQKSGTYLTTTASSNVAAGRVQFFGPSGRVIHWQGYQTTRGDDTGTRPIWKPSGVNTFTMLTTQGATHIENIEIDSDVSTGMTNFAGTAADAYVNCVSRKSVNGFTGGRTYRCSAYNASNFGYQTMDDSWWCYAESCGSHGYNASLRLAFCIAKSCTGNGFNSNSQPIWFGCVAYTNTGSGFLLGNAGMARLINCISYGSVSGYGYENNDFRNNRLVNCAGGGNSLGNTEASPLFGDFNPNFVSLSVNPFNGAAGRDFSLNNTTGGGASLRGAGFPAYIGDMTTTSNLLHIGASQASPSGPGYTPLNTVINSSGINP